MSVNNASLPPRQHQQAEFVTVTAPYHEEDLAWQEPAAAPATHAFGMTGLLGGDRVWAEMAEIPDIETEWKGCGASPSAEGGAGWRGGS